MAFLYSLCYDDSNTSLTGHQHLYPPDTSAMGGYRPPLVGLAGRPPGPVYQVSSSTAGSSGSGSLGHHQYPQSPHFPYASSTNPQTTYNPATPPYPSRQNMPYSVLQPLPAAYLAPSGLPQTVGYAVPVTSTLGGHQATSYTAMQQPSASTGAFPSNEGFSTSSQGASAPTDQPTTTPTQGWNPNPPNYP